MRPFTALPVVAILLALAGRAAHAQSPTEPLLIVALGDSTTAPRRGINLVYAQRLESRLRHEGRASSVLNAGIGGNTTADACRRLQSDVLDHIPDLVIVQFGLNDAGIRIIDGATQPPVPLAAYRKNLTQIVTSTQARGAKVVLMTPNPMWWSKRLRKVFGGQPYELKDPDGANRVLSGYATAAREVARATGATLVDIYQAFQKVTRGAEAEYQRLLPDGLHPNDQGQELVATKLLEAISGLSDLAASPDRWKGVGEPKSRVIVERGTPGALHYRAHPWTRKQDQLLSSGVGCQLWSDSTLLPGNFHIHARLALEKLAGTGASFDLDERNRVVFDATNQNLQLQGSIFGGQRDIERATVTLAAGRDFDLDIERTSQAISVRIDKKLVAVGLHRGKFERFGIRPGSGVVRLREFRVTGHLRKNARSPSRGFTIPVVDLAGMKQHMVIVDREKGQYLGHPTTVLLEDGKTMIAVYPAGHGRGRIIMKRSTDGGLTWSPRLPTPENWAGSKEVPTIHRVVDKKGHRRLILFSGLYPIRMAVSANAGVSWSPLAPIGSFGGIVTMSALARLASGDHRAFFHDDGRFIKKHGRRGRPTVFKVYQTLSRDGGLTWGDPEVIAEHPAAHLCEPGLVRSPDGRKIALLLRENSRRFNSFLVISDNEGRTWSQPRELPAALTGDRHTARYAPDGRLFITFRDTSLVSPTKGDWVGWVGTYDDIIQGRQGQYRVRLAKNHRAADCAYPGLELLPDGTFVTTTYGHWTPGQKPYIISVRFKLTLLDRLLAKTR